jgi:phosphoglycolate phosphatase
MEAVDRAQAHLACVDMAGTVISDDGMVMNAFRQALQSLGTSDASMQAAMDYAYQTMGSPKSVVFGHLLGDDDKVDAAMAAFASAIDESLDKGAVQMITGAWEALSLLRDNGVKICLTTGFSAEVQASIVEKLELAKVCDFWLAPTAPLRGRPYPDLVLTAALQAQVDDVREVAVVGDTVNDLWSGYRAGASVVAGVLTGSHGREQLQSAPHTDIIESVRDFPALVLGAKD